MFLCELNALKVAKIYMAEKRMLSSFHNCSTLHHCMSPHTCIINEGRAYIAYTCISSSHVNAHSKDIIKVSMIHPLDN